MIFCIVYNANCTYCELVYLIGTYIVQVFEIIKIVEHSLDFHLGSCKRFAEVENVSGNSFFFTDTGFCAEILKYALFLFLALVDDTPWWKIRIK